MGSDQPVQYLIFYEVYESSFGAAIRHQAIPATRIVLMVEEPVIMDARTGEIALVTKESVTTCIMETKPFEKGRMRQVFKVRMPD